MADVTRDHIALAAQYQADVLAGTIPACKWVRLACARNRNDLVDRQGTDDFPYVFNPDKGRRICQFAELLPHIRGPKAVIVGQDDQGRPLWNPIVLEPWQCWILTTLFGWVHAETGLRRFRVGLVLVPRKNGKSVLGAIVALYMFAVEGGSGAECYSAATTRDQAKIVAEIAWEMASRSPQFREQFAVRLGSRTTRRLTIPANAAKFEPLSADAQSLDGLNVLLAVIDELHAHRTRAVWDVLDTATGAQLQPLLLPITTAGVEIGGICHEKLGYLEKVLDGRAADETFFGLNYTIDEGDDIHQEVIQRKANPNFGVSVQPDDLQGKLTAAQHSSAALNNILTKHFNVWIRSESGWMTADVWNTCTVKGLTFEKAIEQWKGYPCWIGMDLGETRDPSSLALLFKLGPETFGLTQRIYMPTNVVAHSPIAHMSGWVRDGYIVETPGNEADYARIQEDLLGFFSTLKVQELDFDRRSARLMLQPFRKLLEPKFGRDQVEQIVLDIPQSVDTMDPAMKFCEALVFKKTLQHDDNQAMAWMISNIVIERDHKMQIYPRKAGGKDSPHKIDGAVALFTCLSRAMQVAETPPQYQAYAFGGR
jgi:phage terminase large subunit-like protein